MCAPLVAARQGMPPVNSETVAARLETGDLRSKRGKLKRKVISRQLYNIRRSMKLQPKAWSPEAEAALQSWLSKNRKADRRTAKPPLARKSRRPLRRSKPGEVVSFADRCRDLDRYHRQTGTTPFEGHIGRDRGKGKILGDLVRKAKCCAVAQTGLLAGHSAACILDNAPQAKLISFALKRDACAIRASKYLALKFPRQHSVVYGNSQKTLAAFREKRLPLVRFFDCVFVDGGHSYKCARNDIVELHRCSRPNGLIVVDDVTKDSGIERSWTKGPTRAWAWALQKGLVVQDGQADNFVWGRFLI